MAFQQQGNGTTYPTDTSLTWNVGDIVWNSAPSQGAPSGWVCTAAASGGTWSPFGGVGNGNVLITTATSGTLSSAYGAIVLNPASTGTYSLPNVTAYGAGGNLFIKNIASGSTTLTPLAANGYDGSAAITLAQYATITLRSVGGTTATSTFWYKQA